MTTTGVQGSTGRIGARAALIPLFLLCIVCPALADTGRVGKALAQPDANPAPSEATHLTINEADALIRQISNCWKPAGNEKNAQSPIVDLIINVNPDRNVRDTEIVDKQRYASDPLYHAAADSAVRAVRNPKCNPLELPADKYDQWNRIVFTFDPRDML